MVKSCPLPASSADAAMPNKESVLYDATAACRESFAECVKVCTLMDDRWAALRLADFNLWAAGIGVSAHHKASLDARLSLKPDVRDVIAKILQMLKSSVNDCRELGRSAPSCSSVNCV
jgi:hypothetical protein